MKQVALRDFQLQAKKYLNELPIELISREGIVAIVSAPDTVVNKSDERVVNNPPLDEKLVNKQENVTTSPQTPQESVNNSAYRNDRVATYIASRKPLEGLKPLPEDGTNQVGVPTGKCEYGSTCRNRGKGYKVTGIADGQEATRKVFLCDLHVKKARMEDMEVVEL